MLASVQHKLAAIARSATLGAGAAAALCVGLGFLTVAAWLYLAAVANEIAAALVIGVVWSLLGLALLLAARGRPPPPLPEPRPDRPVPPPLMEAFLQGFNAGSRAKSRR